VVRYAELNCIQKGESELTLALSSNEETKKTYPYDFVFAVSYRLNQNAITVTYHVAAKAGSIPFYVGGHPGMVAPNGQAVIEFGQSENAVVYPLETDGSVAMPKLKSFVANKEFFRQCKTFQVGNIASGKVSLTTEDGYRYHYISNCPVWAFWSNEEGGDYVCVEPWWGINDFAKAPRELSLKPFINFADEEGKEFSYTLQINKDK
jgi:galactose mutarotase-like enzyme